MPTFVVRATYTETYTDELKIEAETQEEADQAAKKLDVEDFMFLGNTPTCEIEIDSVDPLEE